MCGGRGSHVHQVERREEGVKLTPSLRCRVRGVLPEPAVEHSTRISHLLSVCAVLPSAALAPPAEGGVPSPPLPVFATGLFPNTLECQDAREGGSTGGGGKEGCPGCWGPARGWGRGRQGADQRNMTTVMAMDTPNAAMETARMIMCHGPEMLSAPS